jgi:hypothetical protein
MMISKTKAAEQQLNTAIRLFFENRDHLSSYTLAAAAREVTEGGIERRLGVLKEREFVRVGDSLEVPLSYRDMLDLFITPEGHKGKVIRKYFNKWQNFLKHSNDDSDAEIEPFKTKYLAVMIVFAIKNYALLTQDMTFEMKFFFAWFTLAEPELIRTAHIDVRTKKVISDLSTYISGDPYDRNTLETIYTAMTEYNLWRASGRGIDFETWGSMNWAGLK